MRVDLTGIHISGEFVWDIQHYEIGRLLLGLPSLIPSDAVVCFEGCGIADDIRQLLMAHPAPIITKVYPGTIAPQPEVFHVPATPLVLSNLAELAESHSSYEFCDHLHIYRGNAVLLQCYDFMDLPLMLSF